MIGQMVLLSNRIALPYPSPLAEDTMRLYPPSEWRVVGAEKQSKDERDMHQLRAIWQLKMRMLGLVIDEKRERVLRNKARKKVVA
jgi:hypothetical protein